MEFDTPQQAGTKVGGQLEAVRADLSHAKRLLEDAVNSLLQDALSIRCADNQQRIVLQGDDPGQREQLLALSRTIEAGTNNLITHLQFHDMVNQLLDHVLSGLSSMEGGAQDGRQTCLEKCLKASRDDQAKAGKPVLSHDMQAGDVELF